MMRYAALAVVLLVFAAFSPDWSSAAAAPDKPNVLFIAVDDLRPQLGCYGATHMKTPHIDALAARGMQFNRAYCQQAVCSPSRISLLTGRRPDTTKIYDLETHNRKTMPDVVTLPQHFKNNGYHAPGFGKIYHGGLDDEESWSVPHTPNRAMQYARSEDPRRREEEGRRRMGAGREEQGPGVGGRRVRGQRAAGRMGRRPGDRGDARAAKDEGQAVLPRRRVREAAPAVRRAEEIFRPVPAGVDQAAGGHEAPKNAPPLALTNYAELRPYLGVPKKSEPLSEQQAKELIRGYYAASELRRRAGRASAGGARSARGFATTRSSILWGDHGYQLGEQDLWCKHTNFENSTRSPADPRSARRRSRTARRPMRWSSLSTSTRRSAAGEPPAAGGAGRQIARAAAGQSRKTRGNRRVQPVPAARRQGDGLLDPHRPLSLHRVAGGLADPDKPQRRRARAVRPPGGPAGDDRTSPSDPKHARPSSSSRSSSRRGGNSRCMKQSASRDRRLVAAAARALRRQRVRGTQRRSRTSSSSPSTTFARRARLLRLAAREVAEHRRAGEVAADVQPRVLPAGGVQPVADVAADRPPAGHDEGLRPRDALPRHDPRRRHAAAALQGQRLPRAGVREDLSRRAGRQAFVERPAHVAAAAPRTAIRRSSRSIAAQAQGAEAEGRRRTSELNRRAKGPAWEAADVDGRQAARRQHRRQRDQGAERGEGQAVLPRRRLHQAAPAVRRAEEIFRPLPARRADRAAAEPHAAAGRAGVRDDRTSASCAATRACRRRTSRSPSSRRAS